MTDREFIDECQVRGMNDNRQREALDRLEALVKANEELADQAFSAGWYGKTHELGILTAFEAFKDGGYKYRAVVDFAAADAAKKEGGK